MGDGARDGWVMEDAGAGGVPSSKRGPGTNPTAVATANDTRAVARCLDRRVLLSTVELKMDTAASVPSIVAANR
jgi:hypothetical protein